MNEKTTSLKDVLVGMLESVGSRSEIDQYLRAFQEIDSARFALIKVGGGIVRDHRDTLLTSLALLHHVGLTPVLMHGAGPQLDRAFERSGIDAPRVTGLRVTSERALATARRVFQEVNLTLVSTLERRGVTARPILSGVFEAEPVDRERYGFVGDVTSVNTEPICAAVRSGHLPVVSCLGESASGQILNVNADAATCALVKALRPYKVVFLTPTGGLRDESGAIIPAINLVEDYDRLLAAPWVNGGMELKLREIARILELLPERSSVSITSPQHLTRELFTYRGSGTLVRRGDPIRVHRDWADVDVAQMRSLIETAFDRRLAADAATPADLLALYTTSSYSAGAVITDADGMPYLDKFAVTAEAQGQGLGSAIWNRVREEIPTLFWRARSDNPIGSWYFKHADGMQRSGDWIVFWYGLPDRDAVERCIAYALARPDAFEAIAPKELQHAAAL